MSQSPLWWRVLVLSTIVMCIAFAVQASGEDKKAGAFGSVDFQKIQTEFKQKAAVETEISAMQGKLERALQRREAMPLLPEVEHKELDSLVEKDIAARSDKEKKRIEEITTKGNSLTAEARALQQKDQKTLTDGDKAKISENEKTLVAAQTSYNALKEDGTNKLRQFVNQNSEALLQQIRKAIGKVAEQKGLAIVFNSEVAPYAGMDITQTVVGELNKK